MVEIVLINGLRLWLNVLKIMHVKPGEADGVTDIQMDDGTVYNVKSDAAVAAKMINERLTLIHRTFAK